MLDTGYWLLVTGYWLLVAQSHSHTVSQSYSLKVS